MRAAKKKKKHAPVTAIDDLQLACESPLINGGDGTVSDVERDAHTIAVCPLSKQIAIRPIEMHREREREE